MERNKKIFLKITFVQLGENIKPRKTNKLVRLEGCWSRCRPQKI